MNTIDLNGRVAIVTGGARGIGYAIAERLAASGASLVLWDRDAPALAQAAATLSALTKVTTAALDLTQHTQVATAAAEAVAAHGFFDVLVNNAGIAGASRKLWEYTPEEWREVVEVDLIAVFNCCHAVVPLMLKANYGRIINIASIAGKEGNPNASHYSAAKAGVIALTKSLGKELATTGIRVNCITPAVIRTDILKQVSQQHIDYMVSKIPMGRTGEPAEAAAMVAWLASEEVSFTTGAVFDLSGGRATY